MGASWVLPNPYYVLGAAEGSTRPGSTQHYLLMAGNSHQIGDFSRKHQCTCAMVASFCDIINGL